MQDHFRCLLTSGFRFFFTPLPGFFSPFPHGTCSLSVTKECLALGGGPPVFTQSFSCSVLLFCTASLCFCLRDCYFLWFIFPDDSTSSDLAFVRLGFFLFARRYLGYRVFFLFLGLLRCFSSPGSLHYLMCSDRDIQSLSVWVFPFGDLRVVGCLLLPEAFRSLPRPSSPLGA